METLRETVTAPAAKVATALAAAAATSWDAIASMLAAFYSGLLICEWFWKKFFRPAAEARGWIKRKKHRHDDDK